MCSLGFLGREEYCREFCTFFLCPVFICAHTFCEQSLSPRLETGTTQLPADGSRGERSCRRLVLAMGLSGQDTRGRLEGSSCHTPVLAGPMGVACLVPRKFAEEMHW